jgi:hypothetical protein
LLSLSQLKLLFFPPDLQFSLDLRYDLACLLYARRQSINPQQFGRSTASLGAPNVNLNAVKNKARPGIGL